MLLQHNTAAMSRLSLIGLLAVVSAVSSAFAQPIDFSVSISGTGQPAVAGGIVPYAFTVAADLTAAGQEFTVRLTVPPELEVTSRCPDSSYDAATRLLTWNGHYDHRFISCPLAFRVAPTLPPGATYVLVATISAATSDPNPSNNTSMLTGIVTASSDLELTSASDVRTLKPGETLAYTFTVTNHGPQDAGSVVLVDQISTAVAFVSFQQISGPPAVVDPVPHESGTPCYPPRCGTYAQANIGILHDGESAAFRLVVKVKSSSETATITNLAFVSSTSADLVENNNRRDLTVTAGPNADLSLTVRATDDGSAQVPISIEVRNDGPETVNSVTVEHYLRSETNPYGFDYQVVKFLSATASQGTCSAPVPTMWPGSPPPPPFWVMDCALGAMAAGAKATITLVVGRTPRSKFNHIVFVEPAHNDPAPANNVDTLSFPLSARRHAVRR
jgi:uncharacterized repeat protein (TIGR01451 family)